MDPDVCLAEILEHLKAAEKCGAFEQDDMVAEYAQAADKFEALDRWLRQGGFLPAAWGRPVGAPEEEPFDEPQPDPLNYGPDEVDPFPFLRPEDSVNPDDYEPPEDGPCFDD